MKDAIKRLLRESHLLTSAVTATVALLMGLDILVLTTQQVGLLLGALAAWLLVLRYLVTPVASPSGLAMGTIVNADTDKLPTGIVTPMEQP